MSVLLLVGLSLVSCGTRYSDAEIVTAAVEWRLGGGFLSMTISACNADHQISVDETSDSVTIEVRARAESDDEDCVDGVYVRLDSELGERQLIDGTTGESIEVENRTDP